MSAHLPARRPSSGLPPDPIVPGSRTFLEWAHGAAADVYLIPDPRPRQRRASAGIDKRQYMGLYKAVAYANLQGVVLNTLTSITWSLQGLGTDAEIHDAFASWRCLFTKWIRNNQAPGRRVPCAHVWVLERGRRRGLHAHILSYVPDHLYGAYHQWAKRAVKTVTGRPCFNEVVNGARETTFHSARLEIPRGKTAADVQWTVFRYLTKGVTEGALSGLLRNHFSKVLLRDFVSGRTGGEGLLTGLRCHASRDLGPTKQTEWDHLYGLPAYWPNCGSRENLRFDESYLHYGELVRRISNFDV